MQGDEALAVAAVNRHQGILELQIADFQGEILQYYGDGSLSVFKNASDAVQCAIEIQRRLKKEPKGLLCIGLHIGEI